MVSRGFQIQPGLMHFMYWVPKCVSLMVEEVLALALHWEVMGIASLHSPNLWIVV